MIDVGTAFIIVGLVIVIADLLTISLITPVGMTFIGFGIAREFTANCLLAIAVGGVVGAVTAYVFYRSARKGGSDSVIPRDEYVGKTVRIVDVVEGVPIVELDGNRFFVESEKKLEVGDEVVVEGFDGIKVVARKKGE